MRLPIQRGQRGRVVYEQIVLVYTLTLDTNCKRQTRQGQTRPNI